MMLQYARPLQRLITALERLPGIGPKSAQRLAFYLLGSSDSDVRELADALLAVKSQIRLCATCFNFSDAEQCPLCGDPSRDASVICVVEQPSDVMALERSGEFRGLYHVLQGRLSPMSGVGYSDLRIAELLARVAASAPQEIILATSPTVEGDTTAIELKRLITEQYSQAGQELPRMTRIALGLPVGGDLDFADGVTIARALRGRTVLSEGQT